MSWFLLSVASACFLGLYDLAKKAAVKDNAVPPVLFLNVVTAALVYTPILLVTSCSPALLEDTWLCIESLTPAEHGLLFLKSALVGTSWTLALFGLKHLPLSVATPIRSTSPMWTCVLAIVVMGERPSPLQACGALVILVALLLLSGVSRLEGIHFRNNRWVACMVAATLLGTASSIYDKYLLQVRGFAPATLQAWFSIYLVPVTMPMACYWFTRQRRTRPFEWRWTIPLIAILLLTADILYFQAVSDPQALISIISPLRRTAVLIPFLYGALVLNEPNWQRKAGCVGLMLLGALLVSS